MRIFLKVAGGQYCARSVHCNVSAMTRDRWNRVVTRRVSRKHNHSLKVRVGLENAVSGVFLTFGVGVWASKRNSQRVAMFAQNVESFPTKTEKRPQRLQGQLS